MFDLVELACGANAVALAVVALAFGGLAGERFALDDPVAGTRART